MTTFTGGVPFHPNTRLGAAIPQARMVLEAAFGAQLTEDPETWDWTDITTSVRFAGGITMTAGAPDETTEAPSATLTATLGNATGEFTPGNPLSTLYPHVRKGTPIRKRVTLDGTVEGLRIRFYGRATGWSPAWESDGTDGTCKLTAAGHIQQYDQAKTVTSPMTAWAVAGYDNAPAAATWPCEDGAAATFAVSGNGGPPMRSVGTVRAQFAGGNVGVGSAPVMRLVPGVKLTGQCAVAGNYIYLGALVRIPKWWWGGTERTLFRLRGNAGLAYIDLRLNTSGGLIARAYDNAGHEKFSSPTFPADMFDQPCWVTLQLEQSGNNILWYRTHCHWDIATNTGGSSTTSYGDNGTAYGLTFGTINQVEVAPDGDMDGVDVGHITLFGEASDMTTPSNAGPKAIIAYAGETIVERLDRLAYERGTAVELIGNTDQDIGPQPVGTLAAVLRDIERTERGMLVDGLGDGLTLYTRASRYNQDAAVTLPAAAVSLGGAPDDSDQHTANRVRATRAAGGEATVEDVDGPMGTESIGLFERQVEANPATDDTLAQWAQWRLWLGTKETLRWSHLPIDVTANPSIAAAVAGIQPGQRVDVTGLRDALAGWWLDNIQTIAEGWTEVLSPTLWKITINSSPFEPWAVATVDGTAQRLDCDGSELNAGVTPTSTSIPLKITDQCVWTHADGDFDVDVDGDVMTVTAVGSVTGTYPLRYQTLTVTRSSGARSHAAGRPVHVAVPAVSAL